MTIGYSTKWPKSMGPEYAGKPNHFVEKITKSASKIFGQELNEYINPCVEKLGYQCKDNFIRTVLDCRSKKHTFREDPKDRWKVGMNIHPVINNRTKNRFQFAPVMEVKSIQKIEIIYSNEDLIEWYGVEPFIKINNQVLNIDQMETLSLNDGFDSLQQFCAWFNKDFKGKIIHWTDLKY